MPGEQLSLYMVRELLLDAQQAGFQRVRLYGGEPLLHRDLDKMIRSACELGITPYVTTNGILLGRQIDRLYESGLRYLTIGYYGTGDSYEGYVQRLGTYSQFEESIAKVRNRYGTGVKMQINYLLSRRSCDLVSLREALNFAIRYKTQVQSDIVHYSLPYFSEGVDRELQFTDQDLPRLREIADALINFKNEYPELYPESRESIRSIPDWAVLGPTMRIPCTAYRMIWVGADGTVQLCYVTFKLGNLHQTRLRDMLFTPEHSQACRDAFALRCPNCHCHRDERIRTHAPSRRTYAC
jgi:cyclic pyranopterin phosphate synthase